MSHKDRNTVIKQYQNVYIVTEIKLFSNKNSKKTQLVSENPVENLNQLTFPMVYDWK